MGKQTENCDCLYFLSEINANITMIKLHVLIKKWILAIRYN